MDNDTTTFTPNPIITALNQHQQGSLVDLANRLLGRIIEEDGLSILAEIPKWPATDLLNEWDVEDYFAGWDDDLKCSAAHLLKGHLMEAISTLPCILSKRLKRDPMERKMRSCRKAAKTLKGMSTEFKGDRTRTKILLDAARIVDIAADDVEFGR